MVLKLCLKAEEELRLEYLGQEPRVKSIANEESFCTIYKTLQLVTCLEQTDELMVGD